METEVRRFQDESTKDDSEVVYEAIHFNKRKPLRKRLPARVKNPLVTPDQNSFHMNFKIGAMETESKFCTRSPGVRLRTATSNGLTDRTEGLFLTPTFSGL